MHHRLITKLTPMHDGKTGRCKSDKGRDSGLNKDQFGLGSK